MRTEKEIMNKIKEGDRLLKKALKKKDYNWASHIQFALRQYEWVLEG